MINIEDYFEKGVAISRLPDTILSKLWREVYTTEWVADSEGVYKQKPLWYSRTKKYNIEEDGDLQNLVERTYGSDLIKQAPATLIDTANELIADTYFDPLRAFKPTASLTYIHFWNGAEAIPWHYDTIDSSDTLILIYLTEEQVWPQEWGASISFCKSLSEGTKYETTLYPSNGLMAVINNANPLIKHRVEALHNKDVNRYTLSLCYKWN
jgi:hypothetical protein